MLIFTGAKTVVQAILQLAGKASKIFFTIQASGGPQVMGESCINFNLELLRILLISLKREKKEHAIVYKNFGFIASQQLAIAGCSQQCVWCYTTQLDNQLTIPATQKASLKAAVTASWQKTLLDHHITYITVVKIYASQDLISYLPSSLSMVKLVICH